MKWIKAALFTRDIKGDDQLLHLDANSIYTPIELASGHCACWLLWWTARVSLRLRKNKKMSLPGLWELLICSMKSYRVTEQSPVWKWIINEWKFVWWIFICVNNWKNNKWFLFLFFSFFLDSRHFVGIIDTWIYIKRFLEHFFFVITINFDYMF